MSNDITRLIYTDKDIDEVTELQSQLYDDAISFDDYLAKALKKLQSLLSAHFRKIYIFGKLYYVGSYSPFSFLKIDFFNDGKKKENQVFSIGIKKAEKLVDEKKQKSLSVVLIDGRLRGIILHKGNDRPDNIPGITYYNYNDDPAVVFKNIVDKNEIDIIVEIHKQMAQECVGEVYSYLLRTRNLDREYNGSLFLVVKKRKDIKGINVDEYSRIVDLFNHIMHAKLKYDYKQQRNAEWKRVIEQVTHSKYNYHFVISDYLNDFKLYSKERKFQQSIKQLKTLTGRLQAIDTFFFALNKVEFKKIKLKNLTDRTLRKALTISEINLGNVFTYQLNILERSIKTIPATEEDYLENITKYLQSLKTELPKKFKQINLSTVPMGFHIILFDILKNALKNVRAQNPQLKIELYDFSIDELDEHLYTKESKFIIPTEPYNVIALTNNKPIVFINRKDNVIERSNYDRMLGKEIPDNNISNTTQLGLRIIDTIINYDGLSKSGLRWYYIPSKECLKMEYTKSLLLIPKIDFTNGT